MKFLYALLCVLLLLTACKVNSGGADVIVTRGDLDANANVTSRLATESTILTVLGVGPDDVMQHVMSTFPSYNASCIGHGDYAVCRNQEVYRQSYATFIYVKKIAALNEYNDMVRWIYGPYSNVYPAGVLVYPPKSREQRLEEQRTRIAASYARDRGQWGISHYNYG